MLKFDLGNKKFEELIESDLKNEKILERYDFQSAIVNSWETFRNKINLPDTFLIGQEITPHHSVKDKIDLLAFDPADSSIIVIELKRNKDKLQLLQSISYAAMVATWNNERLIKEIQKDINSDPEELIDLITNNELNSNIKIILVAEIYDPEVIITAEWLGSKYGLDITAFAVSLNKLEKQLFVSFDQRLPLKELADVYEERGLRGNSKINTNEITWDEVIPKLQYKFGERAIKLFTAEKIGEPSRRRIGGIRKKFEDFDRISINFRTKYINVYITGKPNNAEKILRSKFTSKVEISEWAKGYSINLDKEQQFNDLIKWLKIIDKK